MVLWDELLPAALGGRGEVDVDEAVSRGVQVGLEGEHRLLVGHVLVLGVKVVDELDPGQEAWRSRGGVLRFDVCIKFYTGYNLRQITKPFFFF